MSLKDKLQTLPLEPGCYLMKDKNGTVIYVGKAKKLKNRVNSYFTGTHNNKTKKLVANIVDFDFIVAPSEKDAFILEYNLIKKYKPHFNIQFMDDASYPYIRLSKEKYPTLKVVRDKKKMKNAIYFGPYPNAGYARELMELLNKLYPLRKCKNIPAKVCLYYHIGLCLGPCEYKIDEKVYKDLTNKIVNFINGDTKEIKDELIKKRDQQAENLQFEKAQQTQELLQAIDHVTSNSIMQSNNKKAKIDVFNYFVDKGYISIVGLLYSDGKLLKRHLVVEPLYDENVEDVFLGYLLQYYGSKDKPKELLLPKELDCTGLEEALEIAIHQPIRGEKKKLIALALENAKINLEQKFDIKNKEEVDTETAMEQLEKILGYDCTRIELYDISHISGTNAVGAQVVYIDGIKSKKDYRLYKVSNGNDDFANMQEVLYRRLFNGLKKIESMPDMIIVDGGFPQIRAAKEILNVLNITSVHLLGLAKNDKHQTSELINDNDDIIPIDKESELFFLLTNMQDEVHRSAISFHKRLRLKEMNNSVLDGIKGVGIKNKDKLLKHFGTINKIRNASVEQLHEVVDITTANNIVDYFKKQSEEEKKPSFDF